MSEFKDMLYYLRTSHKLSQKELADKLGVSPSAISMYENGKREPDFEMEEKIADVFNVSLDTLRGNAGKTSPYFNQQNIQTNGETLNIENEIEEVSKALADKIKNHISARLGSIAATSEVQKIEAMKSDKDFWEHITTLFSMTLSYKKECYKFIDYQKEMERKTSGEISTSSEAI